MSTPSSVSDFNPNEWVRQQIAQFGPVVGGKDLRSMLGFRTAVAFQKARQQGKLAVHVFQLPDRLGTYAITEEVCRWIVAQRMSAPKSETRSTSTESHFEKHPSTIRSQEADMT